jgi:hypothetical protein
MQQVDADILKGWAEAEQGLPLTRERAERLAKSLAPIRDAVAAAAAGLPFEAEPSRFLAVIARLKAAR